MTKFSLVGATAFSLTLMLPISAIADDMQRIDAQRSKDRARAVTPRANVNSIDPNLPIENALRWGYSQGYEYYHSGFGGLYGDGRYPGNTISNPDHPYIQR